MPVPRRPMLGLVRGVVKPDATNGQFATVRSPVYTHVTLPSPSRSMNMCPRMPSNRQVSVDAKDGIICALCYTFTSNNPCLLKTTTRLRDESVQLYFPSTSTDLLFAPPVQSFSRGVIQPLTRPFPRYFDSSNKKRHNASVSL